MNPMNLCFFVSDLHGHVSRYRKLYQAIADEQPAAVFLGGDLLPSMVMAASSLEFTHRDFINDFLVVEFTKLRKKLHKKYPRVFFILGNDDGRFVEAAMLDAATTGIWEYAHMRCIHWGNLDVYGYCYIPPTPFLLKDWERFDVSRYLDPGCIAPEQGKLSIAVSPSELKYATIAEDLQQLPQGAELKNAIMLFHSPPYKSKLDRAALDGKMIDYVPLDVHVGSIAIQRFIEKRQPLLTLHGHVHESARITGCWQDKFGSTHAFSAAHDGPELALVRFDCQNLHCASRQLL